MFDVQISKQSFWNTEAEGYLFLLSEDFEQAPILSHIEEHYYPRLIAILKKHKFAGKAGQSFVLTANHNNKLIQFIFVGIGRLSGVWHEDLEQLRRGVGTLIKQAQAHEMPSAVVQLPDAASYNMSAAELAQQVTVICHMASYRFVEFKSERKELNDEMVVYLVTDDKNAATAVEHGNIVGRSVNRSRRWTDMPANVVTPTFLAEEAQRIADAGKLKATIFGRDKALQLGMGGFCAVDAGSDQDGKFIVLEYKAPNPDAPTIALVGKGVTFDTGGVSLKPSASMTGMKYDMSGAAAVIATLAAVSQLKPNVNVIGIAPTVENMPSGKSARQDDIISFMNGKTAEINSTDAEGRLILADALCYAEKYYKPAVIIDIATLTGACVIALGHFFTAVMTRSDELCNQLQEASKESGERIWRLPLVDDFKAAIASRVADLDNCGSREYGAGSITAGMFLENFVANTPWAHLDIAGTADNVPGISYLGKGGTGSGVRLFLSFILNYQV